MLRLTWLAALSVSALLFGSAVAQADGPITITQASAEAGGVTPGDAPGFPVTISQPGTYVLGSALQVTSGVAIEVTSGDVTIDLAGQEIDGLNKGQVGILVKRERFVVKNGTIMRFKFAGVTPSNNASAANKHEWVFDHVRIYENRGGGIVCGRECQVLNSTVTDNGLKNNGEIGNSGVLLDTGEVIGSIITNNGSYGIEATDCAAYAHTFLITNNVNGDGAQVGPRVNPLDPNYENVNGCPQGTRKR